MDNHKSNDNWSEEVFWSDNGEIENCPFGEAECNIVILVMHDLIIDNSLVYSHS